MSEGLEQYGVGRILGFTIQDPRLSKTITDVNTRCVNQCDALKSTQQKNYCLAKCKVSIQLRIISAIKQSAAKAPTPEAKIKYTNDVKRANIRLIQYQKLLMKSKIALDRFMRSQSS